MPRIRTIKPEYWTDEKIVELSSWARLLYIGIWNFADDNGVLEYKPKQIKLRIFPADDIHIELLLEELAKIKLIQIYEHDGDKYLICSNMRKHQVIDKPRKSNLPLPENYDVNGNRVKSTEISSGREGKGKGKGKEKDISASSPSARPKVKKIIDPVFYNGTYFDLTQSQYTKLRDKANGMGDQEFKNFLNSLDMYIPNNPTKYDRRADGRLKNPANILSRWLDNQTLRSPPNSNPTRIDDACTNHPDKRGVKTIANRWYCRACVDKIEKKDSEEITAGPIAGLAQKFTMV